MRATSAADECWTIIEADGVGIAGSVEACRSRLGVHHVDEAVLVAGHIDRQGAGRVVGAGDQHRLQQLAPRHVIAGLEAGLRLVTGDLQRRDGRGVFEWPGVEDQRRAVMSFPRLATWRGWSALREAGASPVSPSTTT